MDLQYNTQNVNVGHCEVWCDGVHLGHTYGGCTLRITTSSIEKKRDATGETIVKFYEIGKSVEVTCNLAEESIDFLEKIFPTCTRTGNAITFGKFVVGGALNSSRLVLVSTDGYRIIIYKAVPNPGETVDVVYTTGGQRIYRVVFKGIPDTSRDSLDQLFRITTSSSSSASSRSSSSSSESSSSSSSSSESSSSSSSSSESSSSSSSSSSESSSSSSSSSSSESSSSSSSSSSESSSSSSESSSSSSSSCTVGGNKIVNGTMEADANWSDYGTPTNTRDNTHVHGGSWARRFVVDAADEGIQSDDFTSETGLNYKLTFWYYSDKSSIGVKIRKGDDSGWLFNTIFAGNPTSQWVQVEQWVEEVAGGPGAYLVFTSGVESDGTWWVDDVTLQYCIESSSSSSSSSSQSSSSSSSSSSESSSSSSSSSSS